MPRTSTSPPRKTVKIPSLSAEEALRWLLREREACVLEEKLKKLKQDDPLAAQMRRAVRDIRRERNLAVSRTDVPTSG